MRSLWGGAGIQECLLKKSLTGRRMARDPVFPDGVDRVQMI